MRISAEGDRITWDSWQGDKGNPPAPTLVFARDQYMQAVKDVPGYHQILVHVPWNQQSPDEIALEAADVLKKDPNQWSEIVWYGEDSTPPFNGAAWQR